jgi:anti-sigma factor RsiW
MTVHEEWTDQLSDYLDDELPAGERDAVDAHMRSCPPCAAVFNDLKRVVEEAQAIDARPPQTDLWTGIAGRIEASPATASPVVPFTPRQSRRLAFTLPQLAAAAALLMAVSGGITWQVASRRSEEPRHAASGAAANAAQDSGLAPDPAAGVRVVPAGMADAQYDAAVSDLEKALKAGRGHLDASTIAIVEHNIQIIDQAIDQAREALVTDPANSYLSSHLVEARRRKLELLRRATALATETN